MDNKHKKKILISCISILSLLIVMIGTSVALFNYSKKGTTENTIQAGNLTVIFSESTGSGVGINLANAYPINDEIGKNYLNSDQIFDFTITGTNSGKTTIPFEITLEKLENSTLLEDAVKIYLTDITENTENEVLEVTTYDNLEPSIFKIENEEKVLYQDKIEPGKTYNKKFRLRIWLSESIDFSSGLYDKKVFESIVNVHSDDKNGITKIYRCDYEIGHTWNFEYTGNEQSFIIPCEGTYKLETWGAQGGSYNTNLYGGYGGYSIGNISLKSNEKLFINVGGSGKFMTEAKVYNGGYNGGGGQIYTSNGSAYGGEGGGATHIALSSGLLKTLENDKNSILIVSGGGGGSKVYEKSETNYSGKGGSGGGFVGGNGIPVNSTVYGYGTGGTQTTGGDIVKITSINGQTKGSFGKGATVHYPLQDRYLVGAGGGGGFYGGGAIEHGPAGGGSGYIGNSKLTDKVMYCYNCTESSEESTKTISTTCHSSTPTENCAKEGNGYARITLIDA